MLDYIVINISILNYNNATFGLGSNSVNLHHSLREVKSKTSISKTIHGFLSKTTSHGSHRNSNATVGNRLKKKKNLHSFIVLSTSG